MAIATLSPAQAQQVLAVVNGIPITSYDVDQRGRLMQISSSKPASRKEILDDLIDDKVKFLEAAALVFRRGLETLAGLLGVPLPERM